MTKFAAQEDALVRALYHEHAENLLGYVRALVGGDLRKAEDIVQETLLRAWRHAGVLTPETARPWLYRVARNLVVDGHRAARRRPLEVSTDLPGATSVDALAQGQGPDDIDRALLAWQVADALRALTAAHREVIVELYFRDRSVADAAEVLRIPAGTVRSRSYYALRALRLALEERGVTAP
ncbi:sigma-70 family RNA polymerase sigma factor [Actinopolymorpha sp. B17G11]|uniref:sigma-70 family RNA polymerase sigma factor n=1 Tax=Actinopolymorpha sp. B17G11 TaxID=3160861 RepID=UPI0032E3BB14